jgi:hypothetical protein
MDQMLSKIGKFMAWGSVAAIGVVITGLAFWLILEPHITEGTQWAGLVRHPATIIAAAAIAILPWWTMVFCALDADHQRTLQSGAKGPADWLTVMLADRDRRHRKW